MAMNNLTKYRIRLRTWQFGLLAAVFILWWALTKPGLIPAFVFDNDNQAAFFFGEPLVIFSRIWDWFVVNADIYAHLWTTLVETILAFLVGTVTGGAVGMWLALSPFAAAVADPFIKGLNSMPRVILAPIFAVWFGLGIASICKGLGVEFVTELRWGTEDHVVFLWLLRVILLGLFLAGVYLGCRKPKDYRPLLRHSGRSVADFILMDGAAPTLVNMALTGLIGHVYLLALSPFGVRLNGPLVCCVLSMTGFAAFGKHPKNVLPVMAGAVLAKSLLVAVPLTAPGSLLAVLFCTGLAPIAGQFGVFWGMVAGFLHMTIVQNTSILHGGMNLYNNGFAAGLVCVLLLPIIEAFQNRSKE